MIRIELAYTTTPSIYTNEEIFKKKTYFPDKPFSSIYIQIV